MITAEFSGADRLRSAISAVKSQLVRDLTLKAHAESRALAEQMERLFKEEYIRGGHNNRTDEERQGHAPAINDTEVYSSAFGAVCSLGPVWRLLQFGWRKHTIRAKNAPYLHFKGSRGWAQVKQVENPGYAGDDMAGRVFARMDLSAFEVRIVTDAYAKLLTRL